jgi:hypothetical protein
MAASTSSFKHTKKKMRPSCDDTQTLITIEKEKLSIMKQQLDVDKQRLNAELDLVKQRLNAELDLVSKVESIHNIISLWQTGPPVPAMQQPLPTFTAPYSPHRGNVQPPYNDNLGLFPSQHNFNTQQLYQGEGCSYMNMMNHNS